jgi:ABC-type branched-subunit amino acid transport system permease subunit
MITPNDSITFYLLTAIITLLFLGFGYQLFQSTFRYTLRGIKENEERPRALGVKTYLVKW